ncbi:hypothetical protein TNCV_1336641 [Trichonephila clavipes]|nr:hypothetical protein TNCV_1336641 [Trichonephila clavipes]
MSGLKVSKRNGLLLRNFPFEYNKLFFYGSDPQPAAYRAFLSGPVMVRCSEKCTFLKTLHNKFGRKFFVKKSNISMLLFDVGVVRVRIDILLQFGMVTAGDRSQQWSSDNFMDGTNF